LYFYDSARDLPGPGRKSIRMKHIGLFLSFVLTSVLIYAQQQPLMLMQEGGKLFLRHTVAARENWYSIGRLYNASPKEIAPYNSTSMSRGLAIGETLRIPMATTNFSQDGTAAADEVLVPLYHTVKEKEGLYRISQNYNKVSIDRLKQWNRLSSDELSVGTNLVVGYLKVKKDQSPLASAGKAGQPVAQQNTSVPGEKPVIRNTETPVPSNPAKETPPAKQDIPQPARKELPVATGGTQSTSGGAFSGLFEEQTRGGVPGSNSVGMAAAFKSTSGWKDGKYYILMNKVTPGTVVRITNPENSRSIYAKVLGEIPPMKENEGLLARISNAAAAELGLGEGKFNVQLSWTKQ
jgi:LysM repeat protein